MNYYQHHIGDYRRDTAHLSLLEHGIYRQLLDTYYLTEQPIPEETEAVCRRLSAKTDEERKAVISVLNDFFYLDNGWKHRRCEVEIKGYQEKADIARENGKLGGRPKKTQPVISDNQEETGSQANHKPITNNHKPKGAAPFVLPDWIPVESWNGYIEMRKATKKPATVRAMRMVVTALDKLRSDGTDVGAALDQSVRRNWIDIYPPKESARPATQVRAV